MEHLKTLFSARHSKQNELNNKDWSTKKLADLKKTQTLQLNIEPKAGRTKNKDLNNKKEEERKRKALAAEKADAIISSLSSAYKVSAPSEIRTGAISLQDQQKTLPTSARNAKTIDAKIEEMRKKNAEEKADSILSELIISSSMIAKSGADARHSEYHKGDVHDQNESFPDVQTEDKKAEEESKKREENELLAKWNITCAIQHTESCSPVNQSSSLEEAEDEFENKEIELDDDLQLYLASRKMRFPVASQILGTESLYLGSGTLYQDWCSKVDTHKQDSSDCFAKLLRK